MANATTNKEINFVQLDQELGSHGLCVDQNDPQNKIISTADTSPITEAQLNTAILKHNAIFETPTIEEKLATVGLSLDDLKTALGL